MKNVSFSSLNEESWRVPVPAISKAARILREVAGSTRPLGVSELARRCGLGKSTVHGLIAALVQEGFLSPCDPGKEYVLGPVLIDLGQKALGRRLLDVAQQQADRVALSAGETVLFGYLSGDHVQILARSESVRSVKLSAPIGSPVPLLAGALGKAYAAALAPGNTFPAQLSLPRFTERSITTPAQYAENVTLARERGFAVERGEYLPGIAAAAVCFFWSGTAYFLWCLGIDAVTSDEELTVVGRALRAAAVAILDQVETAGAGTERNVS